MMAISDGQATYVVFPTYASGLKPELRGHAYAIYEDHDNILLRPPSSALPWTPVAQ